MSSIELSFWDIGLGALMMALLAGLLASYRLGVSKTLLIASARLVLQLWIIGKVLGFLFEEGHEWYIPIMALVMLLVGGREIMARQKRRLKGWYSWGLGMATLCVCSFAVALFGLLVVVRPEPWYVPQYSIPLLGMIMSNTMSAVSLAMDRLSSALYENRAVIEQRLALGESGSDAIRGYARDCVRTGIMPVVNSMATAGLVSLPGMMTGQILAGEDPERAVMYQIMIWFLIAGGTGFGIVLSLKLMSRRLFDERMRLRLDRLG
ncbi:MAG: iron export ABC transporter permease subunit FetB [Verrucomicrobiota bacterium]